MNCIATIFPHSGELNKYPFDRYGATLCLLMTTPARKTQSRASTVPEVTGKGDFQVEHLAVGATALRQNVPVLLAILIAIDSRNQIRRECLS